MLNVWVAFIIAGALAFFIPASIALVITGAGFLVWENRDRIG